MYYYNDTETLLGQLTDNRSENTDYIITFGHVLAQAQMYTPSDVSDFARAVAQIYKLVDTQSSCTLVAVDAYGKTSEFNEGWSSLLSSLEQADIGNRLHTNGENAKYASLYRT